MRGDTVLGHILRPINDYLNDPSVTNIAVNAPFEIWVRKDGVWTSHSVPSFDFDTLDAASILISQRTGREFDSGRPYVNSTLPGGQRWQGVRPPGTKDGRILWAIRRPPSNARTMDDEDFPGLFSRTNSGTSRRSKALSDLGAMYKNREWDSLCRAARASGASIGLCGPTDSGKTDLIRRFIGKARPNARMVTIETDDELGEIGPANRASLLYDEAQVSSDEAVRIALRLSPKEIVVQEIRGAEAYSMLRALRSGHNGLTSFHADVGEEYTALGMMVRHHPAGREIPEERLMEMVSTAFDIIAHCEYSEEDGWKVSALKMWAAEQEMA